MLQTFQSFDRLGGSRDLEFGNEFVSCEFLVVHQLLFLMSGLFTKNA